MSTLTSKKEDIAEEVLAVLREGRMEGLAYFLPSLQLDRKLYQEVNKVLERIGGKWTRKVGGHVFASADASDLIQQVLSSGKVDEKPSYLITNATAYYPSPDAVVADLLSDGIPEHAWRVLEPSAGQGAISEGIRAWCESHNLDCYLDCCEIVPEFQGILRKKGFTVVDEPDFLRYDPSFKYDCILMNPPFSTITDSLAYITHIEHAWGMLAQGGRIKSVVAEGFTFRTEKKVANFRAKVEKHGSWKRLDEGSFKGSGTGVRTVIISMRKGMEEEEGQRSLF